MPRKCVSLGNLGILPLPPGGDSLADLYAGVNLSGDNNLSFLKNTRTPWVRLFVAWNLWWPDPPGQGPSKVPYPAPTPFQPQIDDLNRNIMMARQAKKKVILTTIGFPHWVNRTSGPRDSFNSDNFVFPRDGALFIPFLGAKPPNGKSFLPEDLMYSRWAFDLMFRYHPNNPANYGVSIDAFEVVNEANAQAKPNGHSTNHRSTALIMATAQSAKNYLNNVMFPHGPRMRCLGPATADVNYRAWHSFTRDLIGDLSTPIAMGSRRYNFNRKDGDFGWSHHNYRDVEQIGRTIGAAGRALESAAGTTAPSFYGPITQGVRRLLRDKWFGWGQEAHPRIWLTEGGAKLEKMPAFPRERDPNHPGAKRQQAISVGAAAEALKRKARGQPGEGVEMFTQFLFYDQPPSARFSSGLCNPYATDPVTGAPTETSDQEQRPAYDAWTKFGF